MLLLFIDQPQRIGWHWVPGSLLVMLAIAVLLRRDAIKGIRWRSQRGEAHLAGHSVQSPPWQLSVPAAHAANFHSGTSRRASPTI